jgi:hypothetical protein
MIRSLTKLRRSSGNAQQHFGSLFSAFALAKLRLKPTGINSISAEGTDGRRLKTKRMTNSRCRVSWYTGSEDSWEGEPPGEAIIYGSAGASPSQAPVTARVCLSPLSICVKSESVDSTRKACLIWHGGD